MPDYQQAALEIALDLERRAAGVFSRNRLGEPWPSYWLDNKRRVVASFETWTSGCFAVWTYEGERVDRDQAAAMIAERMAARLK